MNSKVWLHTVVLIMIGVVAACLGACGGGGGEITQTMMLNISPVTPSEIRLDWDPHPETVTGYDLVRNGVPVNQTHLPGTGLSDRGLEPNTRYCYSVYAVLWPLGIVGKSNEACLTTPDIAGWNIETLGEGSSPALTLDAGNQPHISYRNSDGVRLLYRSGDSWLSTLVDEAAGVYGDTDIAIGPFGVVHLSYADGVINRLMHATNTTGVWISDVADAAAGSVNALSIDAGGHAHMAYEGVTIFSDSVLNYTSNASGSWQSAFLVSFSSAPIRDTDILIDAAGVAHIAFTARGLTCVVYYMTNQGGSWRQELLDDDGYCGAAMAIDSAGTLHLVYSRKFGVVHAQYVSGIWLVEQVDSFGWIGGERVGLAIDAADRLHIAYQDHNADLKYATHVNGTWERYFLDSIGDVGAEPSIAVDPLGRVSIVYLDRTNGTLKLATSP